MIYCDGAGGECGVLCDFDFEQVYEGMKDCGKEEWRPEGRHSS
jgi:hypothetical protein